MRPAWLLAACLLLTGLAGAQEEPVDPTSYAARFDAAWELVDQRYWNLEARPVDWDAAFERYRPKALEAADDDAFYAVLEAMYEELADDHSTFVPPARVAEIRAEYGDLPCLGVFGRAAQDEAHPVTGGVRWSLDAGGVGTVRLPDLASDGVAAGVREAVTTLEQRDARGLVLDVRGNPGGRLITMMRVAGVFQSGFLWRMLSDWTLPIPYPAVGSPATDLPLAVLIDGDVHSAAEGLAGALQRSGRAVTVGETTAGNVEAVLPFCLRDGSQAWIATGVLAPLGAPSWEGEGVAPDVAVPAAEAPRAARQWLDENAPQAP